ncbi:unnamed protein product [Schistosoma turkestanicum]|nr:unnamed protein product [Schistosoma turkestanicum]
MASSDELKNYLRTALNDDGFLSEIKADILKKIFEKIRNQSPKMKTSTVTDTHSNIKLLINELIIEYLNFENLSFTESVFRQECGHGNLHNLPRQFLCQTLQIKPTVNIKSLILQGDNHTNNSSNNKHALNDKSPTELIEQPIPLLYYIIHYLMVNGLNRIGDNKHLLNQEQKSTTANNNNNNNNGNKAEDHFNPTVVLQHNLSTTQKPFSSDRIFLMHEPDNNNNIINWTNSESNLY